MEGAIAVGTEEALKKAVEGDAKVIYLSDDVSLSGALVVDGDGELVANKVEINLIEKAGLTSGKVGDSTVQITNGSQIVLDKKAGYPGGDPVIKTNQTSYVVKGVDGNPIN